MQVHKDYAPGIEKARAEVFPNSRPCDDFFHFTQREKEFAKRCSQVHCTPRGWVKRHFDWAWGALLNLRHIPSLDLFDALYAGFRERMLASGEATLVDYLDTVYVRVVSARAAKEMRMMTRAEEDEAPLYFAGFWSGILGVLPGTGCGSEAGESLHSAWQRQLEALGGVGTVVSVLEQMQQLYTDAWAASFYWADPNRVLSLAPRNTDPSHLSGDLLPSLGRTPAAEFHEALQHGRRLYHLCPSRDTAMRVVAVAATAKGGELDTTAAAAGAVLLTLPRAALHEALHEVGVLRQVEGAAHLEVSPLCRLFRDIAYVLFSDDAPQGRCTCDSYALYAGCEHSVFLQAVALPWREARPLFVSLPEPRRRAGRPRGATTEPRGERQQAARAQAQGTHGSVGGHEGLASGAVSINPHGAGGSGGGGSGERGRSRGRGRRGRRGSRGR